MESGQPSPIAVRRREDVGDCAARDRNVERLRMTALAPSTMIRSLTAWLCALLLVFSSGVAAQQQQAPVFKAEEIEALVAPIALYPDSVLVQALMAATYPLEIVQAARWVQANPDVKGDAAVKAVADQPWDVSVQSLVAFPQVLMPMNDKLDWTQKLGDAFLAQQKDVMEAVQRLRLKAQQAGNLQTSEQQTVVVVQAAPQQTVIKIEPVNPQVIYVPAYNPVVVYGAWGYPAYPPYYWTPYPAYYPGAALATGFAWGVGIAAAGAIFGGANWGGNDIDIDINRATNINRNYSANRPAAGGGRQSWQHDPSHRKGVSYSDAGSREKFAANVPGAEGRRDYRGQERTTDRAGDRTGDRPGDRAGDRPGDRAGDRAGDRVGASDRAAPSQRDPGGRGGQGAFDGVGSPQTAQRDLDRGKASRDSMSARGGGAKPAAARPSGGAAARPSGGGARGGGGRR